LQYRKLNLNGNQTGKEGGADTANNNGDRGVDSNWTVEENISKAVFTLIIASI
jgi:hypothetical protein